MSLFSKKRYRIIRTIENHIIIQKNYGWVFEDWYRFRDIYGDTAMAEKVIETQLLLDAKRMEVIKEY